MSKNPEKISIGGREQPEKMTPEKLNEAARWLTEELKKTGMSEETARIHQTSFKVMARMIFAAAKKNPQEVAQDYLEKLNKEFRHKKTA